MKPNKTDNRLYAFTIVEVLVVTSVFLIISTVIAAFMVETTKGVFWISKKALISRDVRLFTLRISKETLGANIGYVYNDYQIDNRDERDDRRNSGESGDCLILVHTDPHPNLNDDKHYTKLIAYYREPDENGRGPVFRVEKNFEAPIKIDTDGGYDHFEEFLSEELLSHSPAESEIVLELSRGLADGNLFYNFGNNSFIINGEIIHGNTVKEVTNTYNLTISPRG